MRLVLDTNILISAVMFGGKSRRVLESVINGQHRLLTSVAILDELVGVLGGEKFQWPEEHAASVRQELADVADLIRPKRRLRVVKRDPSDNRIIECAVEGEGLAHAIISGDKDLLDLGRYRHIPILTPSEFLRTQEGP